MAVQIGETIRGDAVMNVFNTFAKLRSLKISMDLEISDTQKYAKSILNSAKINNCNFIIFPVQVGSQAYPQGWANSVIDELHNLSNMALCIFGERGFGVSSSTSLSIFDMDPYPGRNQNIFFPFFGTPDDLEIIDFLKLINTSDGISVIILQMTTNTKPLKELSHLQNISFLKTPEHSNIPKTLISRINLLGSKDLVILSRHIYSTLSKDDLSLKGFLDYHCKCSFMTVRGYADPEWIDLNRGQIEKDEAEPSRNHNPIFQHYHDL